MTCNGSGQVMRVTNTVLGRMQTASTCSACGGSGQSLVNRPPGSDANGLIAREDLVSVNIPAGVEDGMQLKMSEKGNDALGNGISGDLIILIQVQPHKSLSREGDNLHMDLYVSLPEAILGASKEIETVQGSSSHSIGSWDTVWKNFTPKRKRNSKSKWLWKRGPARSCQCLDTTTLIKGTKAIF